MSTAFTPAVATVESTRIHTDEQGLVTRDIRFLRDDTHITAYVAQPEGTGPFPVVLLVHEIFGVHEHIRDVARRLAKLGYLSIAPELFSRQGDVSQLHSIDEIRPIVAQVPDTQVLADLDAALDWVVQHGGDPERVAITGFCWGGRITWLYAAHQSKIKAAVAWYGRLQGERNHLQPSHPIDASAQLQAPVLGLYASDDSGIPLDDVTRFQAALAAVESPSRVIVYPGAPHAFYADYRPSYRTSAARDGWQKLQNWLRQHGV
ncbi:dienelactone hydrolase family protein [Chitinibacter sp. FCG-7]|uniref:Dienelactone hydrolase family protein n=1 Tax=Chitinibacter mangrovi TaxID=3153927 RepID=A0AAU7FA02_9NEIS